LHSRQCAQQPTYAPCIFEYVYLARPDSVIDGVSVYETRLRMGEHLADKVVKHIPVDEIDVVIPIPIRAARRPCNWRSASASRIREGFVKNRYIGRTFIMPGQAMRKKSVRQKLNTVGQEFKGKRVLLVDDSIVRGTTSREIVEMARAAGATQGLLRLGGAAGALPQCLRHRHADARRTDRHRAHRRRNRPRDRRRCAGISGHRCAEAVGAQHSPDSDSFDASCFDGCYITGDIDEYLDAVEATVAQGSPEDEDRRRRPASQQMVLNLAIGGVGLMERRSINWKRWPFAPARSAASSTSTPRRST
jgi:amidophosphoribosyltransferase